MKAETPFWHFESGDSPLVTAAIHNGHNVRPEVAELFELDDAGRLREEDPFTGDWAAVAPTQLIGLHSRFEVDLNRPREKAVYLEPEDAWGLHVWKERPSDEVVQRSLQSYDTFYQNVHAALQSLLGRHERVVVLDLHTYNHRREGPDGPVADPAANPKVNIGTGTMDRERWAPIIDRFISELSGFDYLGRHLDVRENVKFFGGNLAKWTHETFPDTVCVLSVEFKKFFMDEWTGEPDHEQLAAIQAALSCTVAGILESLTDLAS